MSSITSNPSAGPKLKDFEAVAAQTSLRVKLDQSGELKRTQFGLGNRILNFITPAKQRTAQSGQDAAVGNAFKAALEAKFGPIITNNVLRECGIKWSDKKGDHFLPLSSWKIQSAIKKASQYEQDPKAMAKSVTDDIFSKANLDKTYNLLNPSNGNPLTAAEKIELRKVLQQNLETAYTNPETFRFGEKNHEPKVRALSSACEWIRTMREEMSLETHFQNKWGNRSASGNDWLAHHINEIKAHKHLSLASRQLIESANESVEGKNRLAFACCQDFATTKSLRTFSDRKGLKAALHEMANQFDSLSKNPTDFTTKKSFYLAADKVATLLAKEEATDKKGKNYGVEMSGPLLYLDAMLTHVESYKGAVGQGGTYHADNLQDSMKGSEMPSREELNVEYAEY